MYSVMLVDDEQIIPKGLIKMLDWEEHGCRVTAVASDGADALRQISTCVPDIIITDIRMPEMDGLALCAWVRKHCQNVQLILLTGYPDFEYAQQAIQYQVVDFVLKPTTKEALSRAVNKACEQLQKSSGRLTKQQDLAQKQQILLEQLMVYPFYASPYLTQQLARLHITLDHYYVLNTGVLIRDKREDQGVMLAQAKDILRSACARNSCYFIPSAASQENGPADHFYVALNIAEKDLLPLCMNASQIADRDTDFVLSIGISRCHQDPLQLAKAAREADDARQFTMYSSQPSIMRCEDLPQQSAETNYELLERLSLVENALENRDAAAAARNLDDLWCFMQEENLPYSVVMQVSLLLHHFCLRMLFSHNLPSEDLSESLPGVHSEPADELLVQLQMLIRKTLARISKTPEDIDHIVFETKQFIDHHYKDSLTLESLASQAHLSSGYLSKLFKKETGVNISTYILNVRIDHAKILLRTTDLKAYEIAEAVGIHDPVYFSKVFKKATGCKPSIYRKNTP